MTAELPSPEEEEQLRRHSFMFFWYNARYEVVEPSAFPSPAARSVSEAGGANRSPYLPASSSARATNPATPVPPTPA